jgi:hypothetical protein
MDFALAKEYSDRRSEEASFPRRGIDLTSHMLPGVPGTPIAPSYSADQLQASGRDCDHEYAVRTQLAQKVLF